METNEKRTKCIIILVVISMVIVAIGGYYLLDYYSSPYYESYNRPGVKNCIDNYSAKTKNFGDVYIPEINLCDERIFVTRFENIPGPNPTQYGIWYNGSERQGELKTKLIALVQLPPSMPNLTKQEIIDMAKNGELLCGGAVKETEYHNYSWKDLSIKKQEEVQNLSNNQVFGSKVERKYLKGILSITKIYNLPSRCSEQTLISYFTENPFGFKNERILIQGDIANYKSDTPYIYGGINQ